MCYKTQVRYLKTFVKSDFDIFINLFVEISDKQVVYVYSYYCFFITKNTLINI